MPEVLNIKSVWLLLVQSFFKNQTYKVLKPYRFGRNYIIDFKEINHFCQNTCIIRTNDQMLGHEPAPFFPIFIS